MASEVEKETQSVEISQGVVFEGGREVVPQGEKERIFVIIGDLSERSGGGERDESFEAAILKELPDGRKYFTMGSTTLVSTAIHRIVGRMNLEEMLEAIRLGTEIINKGIFDKEYYEIWEKFLQKEAEKNKRITISIPCS